MLGDKAGARIPRALTGREPAGPAGRDSFAAGSHDAAARDGMAEAGGRDFTLIEPGSDRTHWHPRCGAFAAYVEGLATPGRLPTRGMFEPTAIYRALPNVWIVDVRRDPLRFAVRLTGTKVVEALGRDLTGIPFAQAFPGLDPARDLERFAATVATRRGTWRRGRPFFDLGQAWAEVEDVVMPFAADGSTVDMLYCCTVFYGYDRMEW